MRKIVFYIFSLLAFLACSEDNNSGEKQHEYVFDNSQLVGEWVSINSSKSIYSNLVLGNSLRCDYFIYQNETGDKSVLVKDYGSWYWYKDRQIMGFLLADNKVPYHQISELSTGKMCLRNIETNATDTYYRVVEEVSIEAGQEATIQYVQGQSGLSLTSCNEVVAEVSSDGIVSGLQGGTTFIEIEGRENPCYVKVNVNSRIDRYSEETHFSIDEIIEKYGEPDLSGSLGGVKMAILYYNPDSELKLVQYDYDMFSHVVALIHTAYYNEDAFFADVDYLDNHFFLLDGFTTGYFYGKEKRSWDNPFIVTPFIKDGTMYVNFKNQDYNDE